MSSTPDSKYDQGIVIDSLNAGRYLYAGTWNVKVSGLTLGAATGIIIDQEPYRSPIAPRVSYDSLHQHLTVSTNPAEITDDTTILVEDTIPRPDVALELLDSGGAIDVFALKKRLLLSILSEHILPAISSIPHANMVTLDIPVAAGIDAMTDLLVDQLGQEGLLGSGAVVPGTLMGSRKRRVGICVPLIREHDPNRYSMADFNRRYPLKRVLLQGLVRKPIPRLILPTDTD
ncbi:MAG: hypothetical protein TR69_WS6001000863 [candidate division WS6 bacterium OLB20]|uniref:Uncharacterized protein n=1 Tax=candidate division WS6 bacterium OLB20 TaxID=1617426 RepID=A0A136LYU9_9BACT|nr:MAG: hypothetical protein TR69_WS6001000863 [candidate division WS6 bacterium OLB20]